jgi:hypothetical protein
MVAVWEVQSLRVRAWHPSHTFLLICVSSHDQEPTGNWPLPTVLRLRSTLWTCFSCSLHKFGVETKNIFIERLLY